MQQGPGSKSSQCVGFHSLETGPPQSLGGGFLQPCRAMNLNCKVCRFFLTLLSNILSVGLALDCAVRLFLINLVCEFFDEHDIVQS